MEQNIRHSFSIHESYMMKNDMYANQSSSSIKSNSTNSNKKLNMLIENTVALFNKKCDMILLDVDDMKKEFMAHIIKIQDCINESPKKELKTSCGLNINNQPKPIIKYDRMSKKRCSESSISRYLKPGQLPIMTRNKTPVIKQPKTASHNKSESKSMLDSYRNFISVDITPSPFKEKNNNHFPSQKLIKKDGMNLSTGNNKNKRSSVHCTNQFKKEMKKKIGDERNARKLDNHITIRSALSSESTSFLHETQEQQGGVTGSKQQELLIKDKRKFSILDIGAGTANANETLEKVNQYSILDALKCNSICPHFSTIILNKYLQAFVLMTKLEIIPIKERIKFAYLNKFTLSRAKPAEIIKRAFDTIQMRIKDIERIMLQSQYNFGEKQRRPFDSIMFMFPSRTAQNALNFLTGEGENMIRYDNTPLIVALFEILYLLLGESSPESDLIENFFQNVLIKHGSKSIKSLFFSVIFKTVFLSVTVTKEQVCRICNIFEKNKALISSNELLPFNKPLSYISFSLKEIYDYFKFLNEGGEDVYYNQKLFRELKKLKLLNEKGKRKFNLIEQ